MADPTTDHAVLTGVSPAASPVRPRPQRRVRRWLLVFAGVVALAAALLHTPFVHRWAFGQLVSRLATTVGLSADIVRVDPLSRTVVLERARLASPSTPTVPYLTAGRAEVRLAPATLRGNLRFEGITLEDVAIDMTKVADTGRSSSPFTGLGSLVAGDVTIRNLSYRVGTSATARVSIAGVSMRGRGETPGRLAVESTTAGTLRFEMGDARLDFETLTGSLVLDGPRLIVRTLDASSATARAHVDGHMGFAAGYPLELDYTSAIDLSRAPAWWGLTATTRGHAALAGHISGPFLKPTATISGDVPDFAWSTLTPGHLSASGHVRGAGIDVARYRLAVPEVVATGAGFLSFADVSPRSTMTATWRAPLLRSLGPLVELEPETIPLVAARGTATLDWPGFVPNLAGLAGELRTHVSSRQSPGDDDGTVVMQGGDTRWTVDWQQALPGDTRAHAVFAVRVDPVVFARSTMAGTLEATIVNAAPMIRRAAKLDISVPDTALERLEAGRATLGGPLGGTVAMPVWQASLDAQDVTLSGLRHITVGGTFTVDPDWFRTDGLRVRAPSSEVLVRGTIGVLQLDSDVTFEGHVDSSWASAPFAPPEWPVAGHVPITGTWITRRDVDDLLVSFDAPALSVATTPVGPLRGKMLSGLATVTGEAVLPELGTTVSGEASVDDPTRRTARVVLSRAPLAEWLALAGVSVDVTDGVNVSVDGTIDASGTLDAPGTSHVTLRLDRVDGTVRDRPVVLRDPALVTWDRRRLQLSSSTLRVGDVDVTTSPADETNGDPRLALRASARDLLALLPPSEDTQTLIADGDLQATATLPASSPWQPSVVANVDLRSLAEDNRVLASDLRVGARVSGKGDVVASLAGTILGASVRADASAPREWLLPRSPGTPSTTGRQRPVARARGFVEGDAAAVLQALGWRSSEIGGASRLAFELTATEPALEAVHGTLTADAVSLKTQTGTFTEDGPWRFRLEDRTLAIESAALKSLDSRVEASGRVSLAPDGPVDLRIGGLASMSLLDAFVAPRLGGRAQVEIAVSGTTSKPEFEGVLTLLDISAISPSSSLMLADLNGRVVLRPGGVESVDLRGQVNGGDLAVSGSMPLQGPAGDAAIRLVANDVYAEYPAGLKNRVSLDLAFVGGTEEPELRGSAIFLTEPYRESLPKLAQMLVAMGSPPAGEAPPAAAAADAAVVAPGVSGLLGRLALNVAVSSSLPLVLDNSLGRIQFVPKLTLVGSLDRPALSGPVEVLDGGRVYLQSRTYTLADSRIDFFPDDGVIPHLQMVGTTRVGTYDVTLRVSGPADEAELHLSSDPPLPERELQGLLLTGQASDGSVRAAGSEMFAVTALSSDLLGMAGRVLGFDSVRIGAESFELVSSDVIPTTRLTVSKTFFDRFELIFSDNLDDNRSTWILLFRPRRGLELRASSRDNLTRAAEFRHQMTFGPGGPPKDDARQDTESAKTIAEDVVGSVLITGDDPVAAAAVRSRLKLKAGSTFDFSAWLRDHEVVSEHLAEQGYLAAQVIPIRTVMGAHANGRRQVALEYRITRGPSTSVIITGLSPSRALMQRVRAAWATTSFGPVVAGALTTAARQALVDEGFVTPTVETELDRSDPSRLVATVNVIPGPRAARRVVTFDGMAVFSEFDLIATALETGTALSAWRDPDSLCLAISNLYAAAGYRSTIVEALPAFVDGGTAVLPIFISEGQATRVGRVSVSGVADPRRTTVIEAAGLVPGQTLAAGDERLARLRVERFYRNLGYRNVAVSASVEAPDALGRTDVAIAVEEGRRQLIRSITVEGLRTTRRSVVDDALEVKAGDIASQAALSATQRRLYESGLFHAATIRLVPAPQPPGSAGSGDMPVNAIVTLVEPKPYQFAYGVEFTNEYGPIFEDFENAVGAAADLRHRNVLGRGLSASLGGRYEPGMRSVRSLFAVPRLGTWPVRTNVFAAGRDEEATVGDEGRLDTTSQSASIEQRWAPSPWLDLAWGYALSHRRLAIATSSGDSSVSAEGTLSSLNATLVIDRRNRALDASRGWFHSSSWQQGVPSLGSDFRYTRYLGRAFLFARAGRVVSATGVRFGALWRLSGTPIDLVDLLFRTGGGQTVRGYAQDQLSATEIDGFALGGTRLLVLNQELRVNFGKWVQGAVFADAGNAFVSERWGLRDLKVGLGGGVRIMTPFAPLRIDVGFPVPRPDGARAFRWHFSIGQIF